QHPPEQVTQQAPGKMSQQHPPWHMSQQSPPRRNYMTSKKVASKRLTPQKRARTEDKTTTEAATKKNKTNVVELDEENEEGFDEEELDVLPECTNLDFHDINDLPVEDDYHSNHSVSSDGEPEDES
ncbi:hypothetical protein MKX01_016436, partial [Papaver californicum]